MFIGVYRVIKGVSCNIYWDFSAICKYYRIFPADIAEKPLNHPVNPCIHLQCNVLNLGIRILNFEYMAMNLWILSTEKYNVVIYIISTSE